MKIRFKYGDSVICLPAKAVTERLSEATRDELCVLLALAADPSSNIEDICNDLGISNDEFMKAVSFWRGSGAIGVILAEGEKLPSNRKKSDKVKKDSAESAPEFKKGQKEYSANAEKPVALLHSNSIPRYTTSEIATFLENDPSLLVFIDNCQQIMGKMFSSAESGVLIGIVRYLDVTSDYVSLLCAFACSHGKKSVHYVETTAIDLYNKGITQYIELEEHLKYMSKAKDLDSQIRKLFGIGKRTLTTKENNYLIRWCGKMGYGMDIIRKAYEITVDNTKEASMPYCNSILESWHAAGYKTANEVDAAAAEYKKNKDSSSGSFDTDDFFEAALRRSYEITGGK